VGILCPRTKGRLHSCPNSKIAQPGKWRQIARPFAQLYQDRRAELDAAERNLCFGRLDFDDDDRFYVGRLGLRSDDHEQLLVDWRARAAEPVDETRLTGEAALLASLRRGRTGRMGDIVGTIQADQDRIIRDDISGILVVEGGPGTGKTVVALHRAAYLLYTYRKRLARRGILVLGPNATFLRYIDQVLPSLGENDVVLATTASLFPCVDARGTDSPQAARVKGSAKMAEVLAAAVTDLRQTLTTVVEIKIDGTAYRLTPRMCARARAEAEERLDADTGEPLPHNTARRVFINAVVRELTRDLDMRAELAADPASRPRSSRRHRAGGRTCMWRSPGPPAGSD